MPELGPCFHAPRHDPAACPHDAAWRFSWVIHEPVVTGARVRVAAVLLVRCMACGMMVSEGEIKTPKPARER